MVKRNILITIGLVLSFLGVTFAHEGHEPLSSTPFHLQWGLHGTQELPNLHPIFVHLPIALLLAAAVFHFLGSILRKEELWVAGKWSLFFGTVGAGISVWSGLEAAETISHDEEVHTIMMAHQYVGIAVLVLSAILSVWVIISKKTMFSGRPLFLAALLVLSALIAQAADFGGWMVYGKGVGVKYLTSEMDHNHYEEHEPHLPG